MTARDGAEKIGGLPIPPQVGACSANGDPIPPEVALAAIALGCRPSELLAWHVHADRVTVIGPRGAKVQYPFAELVPAIEDLAPPAVTTLETAQAAARAKPDTKEKPGRAAPDKPRGQARRGGGAPRPR